MEKMAKDCVHYHFFLFFIFEVLSKIHNDFICPAQVTDQIIFLRELPLLLHRFKQENLKIPSTPRIFFSHPKDCLVEENLIFLSLMTTHTYCLQKPGRRTVPVHTPLSMSSRLQKEPNPALITVPWGLLY